MTFNLSLKFLLGIWLHFILVLLLAASINYIFYNTGFNITDIIQWDALHYQLISESGYMFDLCDYPQTAFFPLFPYLWKLTVTSASGAFILNVFIFSVSALLLKQAFNISTKTLYIYTALPSCFFFAMPYTESCQFLGLAILLIGLKKNNSIYILLGSLVVSLARPTFAILIPTVLILLFLNLLDKKEILPPIKKTLLPLLLGIMLGLLIVNIIQFYDTNVWWGMIKAQDCWEHGLHSLSFPIQSWAGNINTLYDGLTTALTLTMGIFLIFYFFKKYIQRSFSNIELSEITLFSLIYMTGIGLTIILFQKDTHSINRYAFCSPFLLLLMHETTLYKLRFLWIFNISLFLLGYLFGAFVHIQQLLIYILMLAVLSLIIYVLQRTESVLFYILYILLTIGQAFVLMLFMRGLWIA